LAARSPAPGGIPVAAEVLGQRLRRWELGQAKRPADFWLWHGYLARGKTSLLTSQWKTGKTTLISVLLARLEKGGELAGLAVTPGRAAVISEETPDNWDDRCARLQMGDHVSFFCRPFRAKPTLAQWHGLMEAMLALQRTEGLDLVVIDPLAVFLPGSNENFAAGMVECLLALGELTARGIGVLLLHHPRKGVTLAGQAARGTGALASHADILIEMNWFGKPDEDDRRRWLRAYSRHEETRRHLVLELTADGTDYLAHTAAADAVATETSQVLVMVLEDATERLTMREILQEWPEDFPKPDVTTIARGLKRGLEEGVLRRQGTGRRNDPYRYWLPDNEVFFRPGFGASKEEVDRWHRAWLARNFKPLGIDLESAATTPPSPTEAMPAAVASADIDAKSRQSGDDRTASNVSLPAPQPERSALPPQPVAPPALVPPSVPVAPPARPAPEPELSIEEQRRRIRRWPT
jgi:hypothetical protein